MEPQVTAILQYGALGLVAIVLIAGVAVFKKISDAIIMSIAKHSESTDRLTGAINTQESKAVERHHASNAAVTDAIDDALKEIRDEFRAVSEKVDSTARETQHQARQHVQAVTNTVALYTSARKQTPPPFPRSEK